MLSDLWRVMVALCDYRAWWRKLTGRPLVDVVFITHLRDEAERERFFGHRVPVLGHANGPRIYQNGVAGRVRGIYSTAAEMLTKEGRRLARAQCISACEWAEYNGAKVVLLAASTKRLFGRDGAILKERFPNLLFTIGDNGTAQMLWVDVERALRNAKLDQRNARILLIDPYGPQGACMARRLLQAGYRVVAWCSNDTTLADIHAETGMEITSRIEDAGQVDAVVSCTHSVSARLGVYDITRLRHSHRKLLVIDAAEPASLDIDAYAICLEEVVRQDAGKAYSSQLHYVLGGWSRRLLMLSRGVVFGGYAEALALYQAIHQLGQHELAQMDWFELDCPRIIQIGTVLTYAGFAPPTPACFGKRVDDFDLAYANRPMTAFTPMSGNTLPMMASVRN
ncbi:hypothetical protein GCM10007907_33000 [Chitinimonas prasina]|uniref:Uncharacterized protein n=1 Tax=Chitinimonas prasina TaxID=1434937 RepID=A0ABQ5YHM8_9NEIS|nr:hypothetical protein [Chitinimonas prasina]GLR14510.1 hypothetical protein GCM10007907_33000 [Chitinimonas prasina]